MLRNTAYAAVQKNGMVSGVFPFQKDRSGAPLILDRPAFILDRPARDAAIGLLADYLAGRIEAEAVFEGWPESSSDEAVEKLGRQLLRVLPPGRGSAEGDPAERRQRREVLDRCTLFLSLDGPFLSGDSSGCAWIFMALLIVLAAGAWVRLLGAFCHSMAELAAWVAVTIVIVIAMWRILILKRRRRSISSMTGEKWQYWPFGSQADLDLARGLDTPDEIPE